MNSAQRRKAKRENLRHIHTIIIHTVGQEQYFKHDEKVYNAEQWCVKNCKGSWRASSNWDYTEFKFSDHKDATIFALKWV